jgi:MFS family permease
MHRIDVHKLVDEARFNRFHGLVLGWCVLIIIIDGYDLAVAGIALPSIMKDMNVDASTAGFMASSALFGMMFGAIFLGTLSDRIGRRWTISICVFLFSVFTAAAGFASDPYTFSVLRFFAGLGIAQNHPQPDGDHHVLRLCRRRHPCRADRQAVHRNLWLAVGVPRRRRAGAADPVHPEDDAGVAAVPDQAP